MLRTICSHILFVLASRKVEVNICFLFIWIDAAKIKKTTVLAQSLHVQGIQSAVTWNSHLHLHNYLVKFDLNCPREKKYTLLQVDVNLSYYCHTKSDVPYRFLCFLKEHKTQIQNLENNIITTSTWQKMLTCSYRIYSIWNKTALIVRQH